MGKDTQQVVSQLSGKNNNKKGNVLIVGVDSQIGLALIRHLNKETYKVYGTSRQIEKCKDNVFYFDLSEPKFNIDLSQFEFVVICAAITNMAKCEEEPEFCEQVNSKNTKALIDKCVDSECFVVFLSSNAVFDGSKAFYKHTDIPDPITKYGNFKLSVEQYIQSLDSGKSCVLRLTKVITDSVPFVQNWKNNAKEGLEVKAFDNRLISPIDIEAVVDSIQLLLERKSGGIFQLGGNEEISFFDYAKRLFSMEPKILNKIVATKAVPENIGTAHNSLTTHLPYFKNSYSFEGSDVIAASLLRSVDKGIYIDVGANHPRLQNNTSYFYQQGWHGLAIDGNEEFEKLWLHNRPRDIFVTALVSASIKEVEFAIYPDNKLSSMDSSAIQRYEARYAQEEITKKQRTTSTLLNLKNKYFEEQEIHLLSIDVEGEDLNCLVGANLALWKPGVIVIETKNLSLYNVLNNAIVEYLTSFGYRLIAKTPLDAFFVYPQKSYLEWIPKSII